jgi:hypothetical protein
MFVDIAGVRRASEASMLDKELERSFVLALIVARIASRLEEDEDRLSEDVRSVEMTLPTDPRSVSTLDAEVERFALEV